VKVQTYKEINEVPKDLITDYMEAINNDVSFYDFEEDINFST
jgi:5-bromo-4-chloroindolyl phosphate hydrolysis protein